MPDITMHEAATLEEATALMSRYAPDARYLAGGTDLLVDLKAGRISVQHVISLGRIEGHDDVTVTDDGLRIGVMTTITRLCRAIDASGPFAPILDASREMAAQQIRNMATVGGNLASAVPCADLPPILMAMNALVVIWSPGGERTLRLDDFFVGPRQTALKGDEVLIAVVVPTPRSGSGAAYERFALRHGNAIAVAGVAAGLCMYDNDAVREARVVLGAVAPTPLPVEAAADCLVGHPLDADSFSKAATAAAASAQPICDVRGTADFRRDIVGVLTHRALAKAHARAKEAVQ